MSKWLSGVNESSCSTVRYMQPAVGHQWCFTTRKPPNAAHRLSSSNQPVKWHQGSSLDSCCWCDCNYNASEVHARQPQRTGPDAKKQRFSHTRRGRGGGWCKLIKSLNLACNTESLLGRLTLYKYSWVQLWVWTVPCALFLPLNHSRPQHDCHNIP